ncbi:MAG: hypothetical protein MI739_13235 [Bacteroidales bacterium]|nr:hypothetical protein [Bacteroidales bacterium]
MLGRKKDNVEFVDEKPEKKESKSVSIKDFLDGSLLTTDFIYRQLSYLVFLVFLAFVYIANRYHAEKIVRKNIKLEKEISDLRSESITTASQLMFISKQSEVSKLVKTKGLKLEDSVEPPRKIIIEE